MMVSQRLIENESTECYSWNKSTVEFVVENKKAIMATIRKLTYKNGVISAVDVDDIYSELLMSLYSGDDYDILLATSNKRILSLGGFINICIKHSIQRYYYNKSKESARTARMTNYRDDTGIDMIDNIRDDTILYSFEEVDNNMGISLEDALDAIEYKRNAYDYDILLLVFLRIIMGNMGRSQYNTVLKLIGIDKRKMANMEREITRDEDIMQLFRILTQCSSEVVVESLSRRVHGAKSLLKGVRDASESSNK